MKTFNEFLKEVVTNPQINQQVRYVRGNQRHIGEIGTIKAINRDGTVNIVMKDETLGSVPLQNIDDINVKLEIGTKVRIIKDKDTSNIIGQIVAVDNYKNQATVQTNIPIDIKDIAVV